MSICGPNYYYYYLYISGSFSYVIYSSEVCRAIYSKVFGGSKQMFSATSMSFSEIIL